MLTGHSELEICVRISGTSPFSNTLIEHSRSRDAKTRVQSFDKNLISNRKIQFHAVYV